MVQDYSEQDVLASTFCQNFLLLVYELNTVFYQNIVVFQFSLQMKDAQLY